MAVDPTDPDTFEDEPEEIPAGLEAPREDAAEQHTDLLRHWQTPITDRESSTEADPADAVDQAREVELNEDEYR